jgi:hypothetical protein
MKAYGLHQPHGLLAPVHQNIFKYPLFLIEYKVAATGGTGIFFEIFLYFRRKTNEQIFLGSINYWMSYIP